jgi:integrase
MRWSEVDFNAKVWTIPPERYKSGQEHRVPLCPDALAVLQALPRFRRGDHALSTSFGLRPAGVWSDVKDRLDRKMLRTLRALARTRGDDEDAVRLPGWVNHDLRRTLRSRLSALRVPDVVAEMALGHARRGIAGVYDRHKYLDERCWRGKANCAASCRRRLITSWRCRHGNGDDQAQPRTHFGRPQRPA